MAVAQSRRKDAPTPTTANARMRDSACPKFRKDAKPTEQARFDNPATLSPAQQAWYYFWRCGATSHRASPWWCSSKYGMILLFIVIEYAP